MTKDKVKKATNKVKTPRIMIIETGCGCSNVVKGDNCSKRREEDNKKILFFLGVCDSGHVKYPRV